MTDQFFKSPVWAKIGYALSAIAAIGLIASAGMKLTQNPGFVKTFTQDFGYQTDSLRAIAFAELSVALLYAIPQTSYWGAILATGYLGGAVATHVRIGEPFIAPVALGVLIWAGLFLRDQRLRALLMGNFR